MSEEEKPIRVVDRRMFTADGELRPGFEPEDKPEPPPPAATAPPPPPPASPGAKASTPAAAPSGPGPSGSPGPGGSPGPAQPADAAEGTTSQAFIGMVSFLASNVYAALGIDPMTGEGLPRREPAVARQMIDWLGALEQKSRGRLSFEESDLLSRVLYELRMAYVEVVRPPGREPPR